MATKAELERELDDLRARMEEAHAILSEAMGFDVPLDDDEDTDDDEDSEILEDSGD